MPPAAAPAPDPRDEAAMGQALDQAHNAWLVGEVPVGAVIVRETADGRQVVATGYNRPITDHDPTAHAEIVALRHAARLLGNYRLPECEVFVTLEPCAMCAAALLHARVKRVVYAARDPKAGADGSVLDVFGTAALNHHTRVEGGLMAAQAGEVLRAFFAERREQYREQRARRKAGVAGSVEEPASRADDAVPPSGAEDAGDDAIPSGDVVVVSLDALASAEAQVFVDSMASPLDPLAAPEPPDRSADPRP